MIAEFSFGESTSRKVENDDRIEVFEIREIGSKTKIKIGYFEN